MVYNHTCKICDKRFKVLRVLKQHETTHIRLQTNLVCNICTSEFQTQSKLLTHSKSHLERIIISCDLCTKTVSSSYKLQSHTNQVHFLEKNITCDWPNCLKIFKTENDMRRHAKVHTNRDRNFKCKICGEDFVTLQPLKLHSLVHTGEKPFHCKITNCTRSFNNSGTLYKHKKKCESK